MKVLVTGADGFIGSHLTETLVRRGYHTKAFVFYNSFNSCGWLDHCSPEVRTSIEIVAGDIRDSERVAATMKGCDSVLHLAALVGIPYSYHSPRSYVETNVLGTLNIMQAARDQMVQRVVQTSTSEVYGTAQFVPITELHPLRGQSPYAASKIAADQIALSFYASYGTPVTVIRPFNTFGPRQSTRAVIPTIILQAMGGHAGVALGSVTPTRDFSFVADTVAGFIAGLEGPASSVGHVVNLGSGFEVSIAETAQIVGELMGHDVQILRDELRLRPANSEVQRLWASNLKAKELLGWSPKYEGMAGFRAGLSETITWFRDPANSRAYTANAYTI